MAKISKYIKLHKDVLLEYVYNDGNLIADDYKVLTDTRVRSRSYYAADGSTTGNVLANQLFNVDLTGVRYGKVDTSYYSYLNSSDYTTGSPVRHDTLKFHLPINWTFGEYIGFYVRVFSYDSTNSFTVNLTNFFFDMTDVSQQNLMNYNAPGLFFHEKLWGKSVNIEIPSVSQVASQLADQGPRPNSLNANLVGSAVGFSSTSPIFVEFLFIGGKQTVNDVTTYTLGQKYTTSFPQTPEFETLGLKVQHSSNGDFFEIFGTYNDNISEFKKFIDESVNLGHRYYVQYHVTLFEQNVRGKTIVFTINDGFNEPVEFRPIIKYSTTTAILDVEMRLIDAVDDSYIMRRASYGMLQDEVSKYSLNMMKINLASASKPKVYNVKNNIDLSLVGKTNSLGRPIASRGRTGIGYKVGIATNKGGAMNYADPNMGAQNGGSGVQIVKVPYAVLVERNNIIGKSDNAVVSNQTFYGNGKMQIQIYPFDNILKFIIADGDPGAPSYLDMSGLGEIKIVFKNDAQTVDFPLMIEAQDVDVTQGQVAFKIPQTKFQQVKRIFQSGVNIFYITSTNGGSTTIVFTGLFQIYDTLGNVGNLNANAAAGNAPSINKDPNLPKETAIVTKKLVSDKTNPTKK